MAGWTILPQCVEHDVADRFTGLPRKRARQVSSFSVADVNLIFHDVTNFQSRLQMRHLAP